MKTTGNILLAMFWIAGFMLAGSDSPGTIKTQFLCCTAGVFILAGASYGLEKLNRG